MGRQLRSRVPILWIKVLSRNPCLWIPSRSMGSSMPHRLDIFEIYARYCGERLVSSSDLCSFSFSCFRFFFWIIFGSCFSFLFRMRCAGPLRKVRFVFRRRGLCGGALMVKQSNTRQNLDFELLTPVVLTLKWSSLMTR